MPDLESIAENTFEHRGAEQEDEYLGGIWDLLEKIAGNPAAGRLRTDLGNGCRSARYRRHVVFLVIKSDRIEVLRVLHGSMDFGSHLPEDLI